MTKIRDKKVNRHHEICDTIERLYPNTLKFTWKDDLVNSIVMVDSKITKGKLKLKEFGNNIVGFEPLAQGYQVIYIHLRLDLKHKNGFIFFKTDIGLSDESCVNLFRNNIALRFNHPDKIGVKYDQKAIMRRHTINEIMK